MGLGKWLKDSLDWGKRLQFAYQAVIFIFGASVVETVRAMIYRTSVPLEWRIPIYLFTAGFVLLLLSWLGRWISRRNRVITPETTDTLEEIMHQGGKAALYDYLSCRAKDLSRDLNLLWHHWDNAGEKLIHPLTGELERPKGDNFFPLINERRDFMVLYGHHLMIVGILFPDFTSETVKSGYPSTREYADVYRNLNHHAEELERHCRRTWELYGRSLDN